MFYWQVTAGNKPVFGLRFTRKEQSFLENAIAPQRPREFSLSDFQFDSHGLKALRLGGLDVLRLPTALNAAGDDESGGGVNWWLVGAGVVAAAVIINELNEDDDKPQPPPQTIGPGSG